MVDKMLFIEVKPNVVVRYGVERNRDLEEKSKLKKKISNNYNERYIKSSKWDG